MNHDHNPERGQEAYVTYGFTPVGYVGALLFVLAPAAFFTFYHAVVETTLMEETPNLGWLVVASLIGFALSLPLMLVGRYQRLRLVRFDA